MNPRRLAPKLRLGTLVLAGIGFGYLGWRYDLLSLPEGNCSPLLRFASGSRLLVDTRPHGIGEGDALLVRGPDGRLHLGRVTRVRPEGAGREDTESFWLETDNADCPGASSADFDWIPRARVAGRALLALPI
ncbi:MAG: hypothetical protein GY711_08880 [bacterium]|nr:hypothetical protein [bacterium]